MSCCMCSHAVVRYITQQYILSLFDLLFVEQLNSGAILQLRVCSLAFCLTQTAEEKVLIVLLQYSPVKA